MDNVTSKNRGPLILAIVLLLLPVLYVGSYSVLVVPGGRLLTEREVMRTPLGWCPAGYRVGGQFAVRFFWPLEQIDRRIRPGTWEDAFWDLEPIVLPLSPPRQNPGP